MLPDPLWLRLREEVTRAIAAHVPEWVDANESDPGITLLQLVAHLADELVARGGLPGRASVPASRLADVAARLEPEGPAISVNGEPWRFVRSLAEAPAGAAVFSTDEHGAIVFGDGVRGRRPASGDRVTASYRHEEAESVSVRATWPFAERLHSVDLSPNGRVRFAAESLAGEMWSGLKRPRYFEGRLLTAADFQEEQQYLLRRFRRHLRALHGTGVVCGLEVEAGSGGTLVVRPGLALDPEGREIRVVEDTTVTIPPEVVLPACVSVEYAEREIDPAPSYSGSSLEPLRIEEGCRIVVGASASACGVPIALLTESGQGPRVDRSYVPPRAR